MKKEGTKQVLSLDVNTAKKLYKDASQEFKILLEENFGKSSLIGKPTTFEEACEMADIILPIDFGNRDKQEIAAFKLKIIIKVLNGDQVVDFANSNQAKYYPYWDLTSGLLFFYSNYGYLSSDVPAHLCFLSREDCEYTAKQFIDLYKDLML